MDIQQNDQTVTPRNLSQIIMSGLADKGKDLYPKEYSTRGWSLPANLLLRHVPQPRHRLGDLIEERNELVFLLWTQNLINK